MRIRQIKNDLWQVSAMMDGGPGDSQPIPVTIRFKFDEELGCEFLRSWAWSCSVPEEESWMLRSWLEENEVEIVDLILAGQQ